MDQNNILVKQLTDLLKGGQSHIRLEDALDRITYEVCGKEIFGVPYTIWQLLEHMRFSQRDILEFSVDAGYKEMKWPDDYWVKEKAPQSEKQLQESKQNLLNDRDSMIRLLEGNKEILLEKIPHGTGQTLMREAMILAEHNAYHLGEIIVILRFLAAW